MTKEELLEQINAGIEAANKSVGYTFAGRCLDVTIVSGPKPATSTEWPEGE